jgi:predicted DCC family thiol-disulfide oxidoreductase YuxK
MTLSNWPENPQGTVLYDETCPLCRLLAELVGRRAQGALQFVSWQSYWNRSVPSDAEEPGLHPADVISAPDRIHLVIGEDIFAGVDAWQRMLSMHPDFAGLNWLAAQLGLSRPLARVTEGTAAFLRRLCPRCPR